MRDKRNSSSSAQKQQLLAKDSAEWLGAANFDAKQEVDSNMKMVMHNVTGTPDTILASPGFMPPSAMMLPAMLVGMEGDQVWQYGNRTIKELMNGPYMPSAPGTTALAGHDRERHTRLRDGLHSTSGESPVRAVTEAVALTSYGAT